jgi:light-regulated signal transduction histidine kinase (bacteriophytochrome)
VSVLRDKSAEQLDDNARRYLDKISDSAEKMGKMIDDLLSFSRVGRAEMMKVPIDMHQLVMEVRRDIDENYPQPPIDWRVGSLPRVKGDVTALRQVVVNLLDNAAKYSSQGENPRIEVMAERLDGGVVFSIRDNGVGFDPTYAEKLFKVFQRLHREDEFAGTGIGLASVRRIIQRHGGWVTGESEPGQGACFRFTLPEDSGGLQ